MKRDLLLWQFAGFSFVSLIGSLLHFLYGWTNESVFVAPFSAVNESTWEHMKLLYFPLFIFAFVQSRSFKDCNSFWCVKFIGIVSGLVLIPILFYTYNGAFGKSPDWVNIAIFFISAVIVFLFEKHLFKKDVLRCENPKLVIAIICVIGMLFVVFTFITPQLPIFMDPLTGKYGA